MHRSGGQLQSRQHPKGVGQLLQELHQSSLGTQDSHTPIGAQRYGRSSALAVAVALLPPLGSP